MSTSESSTPSSSSSPEDSSIFKRWSRTFGLVTGIGVSETDRLSHLEEHHGRTCEKWKAEMMNYSPSVVFMLKHLKLSGCIVKSEDIICAPCDFTKSGGFASNEGAVVLCQGKFMNKTHMEHTLVHELVHMYDHCKFKVDWNNLRHHACSEIRANSLSGDCRYARELRRGIVSFSKQHQACVRRRAVLSVRANPACPDEATAERAVNEVWESCFNDTRPFDEVCPVCYT